VPGAEHVGGSGPHQSTDDHGDREGIDPIVMHQVARRAKGDEAPDDHSDEREDRVPGEAERSDVEVRIEGEVDQTAKVRACACGRVSKRKSMVTAAANTRTAMAWSCRRPKAQVVPPMRRKPGRARPTAE